MQGCGSGSAGPAADGELTGQLPPSRRRSPLRYSLQDTTCNGGAVTCANSRAAAEVLTALSCSPCAAQQAFAHCSPSLAQVAADSQRKAAAVFCQLLFLTMVRRCLINRVSSNTTKHIRNSVPARSSNRDLRQFEVKADLLAKVKIVSFCMRGMPRQTLQISKSSNHTSVMPHADCEHLINS